MLVAHDEDKFDVENQSYFVSNNSAKVWTYPPQEQKKQISRRQLLDWTNFGNLCYALTFLGVNIGYSISLLPSDLNLSPVFLIFAPLGPCLNLLFPSRSYLAYFITGEFWYVWILLSGRIEYLPIAVGMNHLLFKQQQEQRIMFLFSIIALGFEIGMYYNIEIFVLSLFMLLGSIMITQKETMRLEDILALHSPRHDQVIHLSLDEVNSAEACEEINLAKLQVEQKRPGILDRISKLQINFDTLNFNKKIGAGSFGEVYEATRSNNKDETNQQVIAVKRIPRTGVTKQKVASMLTEIDVVAGCYHPNVVKMLGWCDDPYVLICLEFANGGSVRDYLRDSCNAEVGWSYLKTKMAMDAAAGLTYLHNRGILHRDVKAENLLVFCGGGDHAIVVKLSDFGSSRDYDSKNNNNNMTAVGSPYWFAPEVASNDRDYGFPADVWSFGVCLCEIACHALPYENIVTGENFFNLFGVIQGHISPVQQLSTLIESQKEKSEENLLKLKNLVEKCCKYEANDRVDMNNLMFELLQLLVLDTKSDVVTRITESTRRLSEDGDELAPLQSPVLNKKPDLRRISDPTSARKRSSSQKRLKGFDHE